MAGAVSEDEVVEASLKGIIAAQNAYETWSAEWLWKAPEYLSTVHVASAIRRLSTGITLENSARSAIKEAGAKGRGRLRFAIRANGRIDILLWWANGTPRAPIEVKSQVLNINKIRNDLHRIVAVLNTNSQKTTIKFGLIVFYSSCIGTKGKLLKALDNIRNDAKAIVGHSCQVRLETTKIFVVHEYNSAWAGAALVIKPKHVAGVL